jgi:hypothetical protein
MTDYTINKRTYSVDDNGAIFFNGHQVVAGSHDGSLLKDLYEILSEREALRAKGRTENDWRENVVRARAATDDEVAEDITETFNWSLNQVADAPPAGTVDINWHGFVVKGVDRDERQAEVWHEEMPETSITLSRSTDDLRGDECGFNRLVGHAYAAWVAHNFPEPVVNREVVQPGQIFQAPGVYHIQGNSGHRVYFPGGNENTTGKTWFLMVEVPE